MRYPLEKLSRCCVLKKGLIRHLIIWETLHFNALTWIWLSKVKDQLYPKKGGEMVLLFFHSQKLLCTIGYHPNNYIIEYLSHSWGTTLKNCLGAKGLVRHLIIWKPWILKF